jgi:hypothetical protein
MAITANKLKEAKFIIEHKFSKTLTGAQTKLALTDNAIKMLWSQGGDAGANPSTVDTWKTWLTTKPLAMSYLTGSKPEIADFIKVIDGTVTPVTTAADALPATYVALHAETVANEPALKGLIALRVLGVDSTYGDGHANIGGTTGAAQSDATVMGLYGTYGAAKFNAIYNKGVIKAIQLESDATKDTIAEVVAIYDGAWPTTNVKKADFFGTFNKFFDKGIDLKFSELHADVASPTNFAAHTSDNALKLMGTTGGSWATVSALASAKLAALTSASAITAIEKCSATFTLLSGVYDANLVKFNTLLSPNSLAICSKPSISNHEYTDLSTGYGTTYTTAADDKFKLLTSPNALIAIDKCGATYSSMSTIHTASPAKLNALLSNDAIALCSKGGSAPTLATLSTAYGTTYTPAKEVEFLNVVKPASHDLFAAGATYANVLALGAKLDSIDNNPGAKKDIIDSGIANTMLADLVSPSAFSGLETVGAF